MHSTTVVTVRLAPDEVAAADALARARGCSRSEAIRFALSFGVPLARQGVALNLPRIALLLEYIQAGVDLIVSREHADFADRLEAIALGRVEEFHA
jgi:hypothetical protein